jgi:hypothetical protein
MSTRALPERSSEPAQPASAEAAPAAAPPALTRDGLLAIVGPADVAGKP